MSRSSALSLCGWLLAAICSTLLFWLEFRQWILSILFRWSLLSDPQADRLNPPMVVVRFDRDGVWERKIEDDHWLPVGYIPRRKTRLGWFAYHLWHGLSMGYPWWKVIIFSFLWTNPGEDEVRYRYWEG